MTACEQSVSSIIIDCLICVCYAVFRYQFFLQVKHDIVQGRLPVGGDLAAELAAYAVQCELSHFNVITWYILSCLACSQLIFIQ